MFKYYNEMLYLLEKIYNTENNTFYKLALKYLILSELYK